MMTKTDLNKEQIIEIIEEEYIKMGVFADDLTGKDKKEAKFVEAVLGSILYRIEHGITAGNNE